MPQDHSLALRRALITALRADAGVAALVGTRVTGPAVEKGVAWPFLRVGTIIAGPYEATCLDGMDATFAIHAFDNTPDEQAVATIMAAVVDALDGAQLTFAGAHTVSLDWATSNVLRDTEESAGWHGVIQFETKTSDDY